MGITYDEILEKIESKELSLLECIVKNKLGIEYSMDKLEQIKSSATLRARKYKLPLKSLIYKPKGNEGEEIILNRPAVLMDVCLRVLDIQNDELTTRDIYLGTFPLGCIAEGLNDFKQVLAAARNDAYLRLQALKYRKDIFDYFRDIGSGIVLFDSHNLPYLFKVDLYQELRKTAKELFGE